MKTKEKYLTSFQRKLLEENLNEKRLRPEYECRIKIMLLTDEGLTKTEIVKTLKCNRETVRYWSGQAKAGQAHNWRDSPRGRPKIASDRYINRLKELAAASPRDFGYAFERWTGQWLSKHLNKELGIKLSPRHINRLLKQMRLSIRAKSPANNDNASSIDDANSATPNYLLLLCLYPIANDC